MGKLPACRLTRFSESSGLKARSRPIVKSDTRRSLTASFPISANFPNKVGSLPLPITGAFPDEPVVPLDEWHPRLTLVFTPDLANPQQLNCFFNGSPEVSYEWLDQPRNAVVVTPRGRLNVGRNRINCTLPIGTDGRFGWYSHNWIRRHPDGSWYSE